MCDPDLFAPYPEDRPFPIGRHAACHANGVGIAGTGCVCRHVLRVRLVTPPVGKLECCQIRVRPIESPGRTGITCAEWRLGWLGGQVARAAGGMSIGTPPRMSPTAAATAALRCRGTVDAGVGRTCEP
jgi:hypothetical protein